MAPVHYYKMAQSPLPGRSCPKTASELILITPQNIRLLIITVVAICLTALSAVSNDEAEANNHDSSKPFSESHNSLNEQQKVFRKGDTLTSLLKESKVSDADIFAITRLLARKLNLNEIHVGQTFLLYSYKTGKDKVKVHGLILQDPGELQWTIVRSATDTLVFQKLTKAQLLAAIQSSVRLKKSADAETPFSNTIRLKQGDTLIGLLRDLGLNETDIKDAVESLTPLLNLRHLQVNQRFELKLQSLNGNIRLVGLTAIGTRAGNITIALPLKRRGSSAAPTTNPDKSEKSAAQTNYPMTHGSESSTPHVKVNPEISTSNVPNNVLRKELLVLEKGDSFASRLIHTGVNARDAFNAAQALSQNTDLSRLPVGQEIHLLFSKNPKTNPFLMSVIISPNSARPLRVNRQKDGTYNYRPLSKDASAMKPSEETEANSAPPVPATLAAPRPDKVSMTIVKILPGDTLENILRKQKVSPKEIRLALRSLKEIHNSDDIRAGQRIALQFNVTERPNKLQKMIVGLPADKTIVVEHIEGNYTAYRSTATLMKQAIQLDQKLRSLRAALKTGNPSQTVLENYGFDTPENTLVTADRAQPSTVLIQEGDTLFDALVNSGVSPMEAEKAISTARKLTNPRKLKPGQTLHLFFAKATTAIPSETGTILAELAIDLNVEQRLRVARLLDGTFVAGFVSRPLQTHRRTSEGIIKTSLYEAAAADNVPAKTLAKLIRIFSYDVDFQRDIRKGDKFQIFYEVLVDDEGRTVDAGEVLYSSLNLSGASLNIYKFTLEDGTIDDYFDDQGQSVRKALMRTPIDGARLTSSYGNRKHPTLGYTKMHRGVDFGAPRGTPIFAAGDGVVDKLASQGAYGNYIRVRHGPVYHTAYAHLQKFAQGMRTGKRVKQGDTIGFVGSTGRSTGPHLHYEVLKHGKQVNPMGVTLPSGLLLRGNELVRFKEVRQRLLEQFASQLEETS